MSEISRSIHKPAEGLKVRIMENERILELEYHGALTEHKSSLWWGTAVGFRAMQMAAVAMSGERLWRREGLYIVSGHPGPGVLDSIRYVTGCADGDGCYVMKDPNCGNKCNSAMKFEWWISDGDRTAEIKLRRGFVPPAFYELSDRLFTDDEREDDRHLFEIFKVNLSTRIWNAPLEENFSIGYLDRPLRKGELPEHEWNVKTA